MKFGEKLRTLRQASNLSQRALAAVVGVERTYLSKIENSKLNFGDYPGEDLICKLADALDTDPNELLILAEKIPSLIKQRVMDRPDAFLRLAALDDKSLDSVLEGLSESGLEKSAPLRKAR